MTVLITKQLTIAFVNVLITKQLTIAFVNVLETVNHHVYIRGTERTGPRWRVGLQRVCTRQRQRRETSVSPVRLSPSQIQPHQHLQDGFRHRLEVFQ